MKKIKLTQNKYALVDDEDFGELNKYKWFAHKSRHGYYAGRTDYPDKTNYLLRKTIKMHRTIMNCPDGMEVDHRDGNGLNNQKENLRNCTQSQNSFNKKKPKNNTSGFKGVSWDKANKKWVAQVRKNNKQKHIGYFTDIDEARLAYIKEAKKHFGEFYNENNG